jgi:transposase InsO family protein
MPWKTHSLLVVRQRFVYSALCAEYGISQKTGFKWLKRFRTSGRPGLRDHSRRPKRSPNQTSQRWIRAILSLRRRHPSWGAKKIYARLRQEHPRVQLPKERTIADWLRRLKLARPRRPWARRGPRLPCPARTLAQRPNDVWTVDFKGWFRTRDGQRVDPLTVRDLFSRFILGIGLVRHRHEPVREYFQGLFRRFGQPRVIRVDHGVPFAGDGALDLSRLSAWWLRLGIQVEFTRRASPQDNGAHEQMHRVYKAEVTSPPAATPRGQQWRTHRWIRYYNTERPHEALGQKVPATLYRKSRRRYQEPRAALAYPRKWFTRRVTASGYVRWRKRLRVIGRAFGGQNVGFKPISFATHEVYFGEHLIGLLIDTDAGGMRPASRNENPK